MGQRIRAGAEWAYDRSLDCTSFNTSTMRASRLLVADLNQVYLKNRFLGKSDYDHQSFQWINAQDANSSVLSFVRFGARPEEVLL